MKNKSLPLIYKTILGATLIATPVIVLAGTGPYVGLEGGANWERPQNVLNGGAVTGTLHYKTGWAAGVVGGYAFANGLRPELELGFRRNQLGRTVPASASIGGFENAQTVMANLWYDYKAPSGLFHWVHPYIGGGVGAVRFAYSGLVVNGVAFPNAYNSRFGFQGGAGVGVDLTPNLTVSADYRYIQSAHETTAIGSTRYRANTAMLGVRYSFGHEPMEPVQAAPPPPPPPAPMAEETPPPATAESAESANRKFEDVHFAFDKSNLSDGAKASLTGDAQTINKLTKANPQLKVNVAGHTDWIGTAAYNQALSERRANAVKSYLGMKGVDASRIDTFAYGESKPIAPNTTAEGRALNRRAEVQTKNP